MFDKVPLVNLAYFLASNGRDISEVYRVLDARDFAQLLENAGFLPNAYKLSLWNLRSASKVSSPSPNNPIA